MNYDNNADRIFKDIVSVFRNLLVDSLGKDNWKELTGANYIRFSSLSEEVSAELSFDYMMANNVVADNGDVFEEVKLKTHLSWNSYSTNPAADALTRAMSILTFSQITNNVAQRFGGNYYHFVHTAADVANQIEFKRVIAEKEKINSLLLNIMEKTSAKDYLRVHSEKLITDVDFSALEMGTYTVNYKNKIWELGRMESKLNLVRKG